MTTTDTTTTGRDLNGLELKRQLGMDLFAISGGRMRRIDNATVDLPVSAGYRVRIHLDWNDTYTVTRVFVRGAKTFIKGTESNVYCDEIGNVAYAASCYRSGDFGS